jgi:hypothetical protein
MNYLITSERRFSWRISGPVQERDGWRIRTNHELNKLIGGVNTMRSIKALELQWWGHLHRTEEYRMVRRIFEWSTMGKRSRGCPRNRWRDSVLNDIRVLAVKNWTKVVTDKLAWHDLVEKSKTHRGLQDKRRSYIYIYR